MAFVSFESYLSSFDESRWLAAVGQLLPSIHEVDRNAVQIWFRFYPWALHRFLAGAADASEARRTLAVQGDYGLEHRIDTSHVFLYGHRYWNEVKSAIDARAKEFSSESAPLLTELIRTVAAEAANTARAGESLLVGITAVGLMTVAQVGIERFMASTAEAGKPKGLMAKSPDAVVAARANDDSQGLLGFLKTVNKKFSVIYDESAIGGRFDIINDQEIAAASANDRSQNWQEKDNRCWEGPVPVECTSASCGTCWVGVIAGQEKLSEVARREKRAIKVFGYDRSEHSKPVIRLACQAKAYGNVTIVIPPWNAVFGKKVYGNVEELELEPVTTSAKALREAVGKAVSGGSED